MRRLDGWGWLLLVLGLGAGANALWMLADPLRWYHDLPAGVPDTGPFNPHFVRDIGCAFLAVGVGQVWAAFRPAWRAPLVGVAAIFAVGHAVLHVYDTARGAVPSDHWWLDLPGVYVPALVLGYAALVFLRAEGGDHASRTHRTT
ncbi:MAG TPA: hypothetical protein VNF72_01150 [Myxococcota bacterium]|jgi:hypothetical protein|nr:hypothetical protein [Myxococcota bacterium]